MAELKPFTMEAEFCAAVSAPEEVEHLYDRLVQYAERDLGLMFQRGHAKPMEREDVIRDSPLYKKLRST